MNGRWSPICRQAPPKLQRLRSLVDPGLCASVTIRKRETPSAQPSAALTPATLSRCAPGTCYLTCRCICTSWQPVLWPAGRARHGQPGAQGLAHPPLPGRGLCVRSVWRLHRVRRPGTCSACLGSAAPASLQHSRFTAAQAECALAAELPGSASPPPCTLCHTL